MDVGLPYIVYTDNRYKYTDKHVLKLFLFKGTVVHGEISIS